MNHHETRSAFQTRASARREYSSSAREDPPAWALADILHRNGLPHGVLNLVMGRGSVVGQAMLEDAQFDGISFTGSTGTGQRVAQACLARMAKFQLETGGKNPFVVLDDAYLDVAVNCAVKRIFPNRPALHGVESGDRHGYVAAGRARRRPLERPASRRILRPMR